MIKSASIILFFCMQLAIHLIAQETSIVDWKLASQLPDLNGKPNPGLAGPLVGIHHDILLIAGGANFPDGLPWEGGQKKYHTAVYLYGLSTGQPIPLSSVDHLSKPLAYSASCNSIQGIVTAGGENANGYSTDAFLFALDAQTQALNIQQLPLLPVATSNAVAVSYGQSVFLLGGETAAGTADACWTLDLNNLASGWKSIEALPAPRAYATAVVTGMPDNPQIVLLGGRRKTPSGISEISASVFAYSLKEGSWTELKSLPYPISAGTAVPSGNDEIILLGGDRAETFTRVEQTLAAIAKADERKKALLINQKNQLLSNHPGFSKAVLSYHPSTGICKEIGAIPFPSPVTTTALVYKEMIILPSGEIRAGVRTPAVLTATIKKRLK
jgi:N-acetylneuraminic acid mutarotase